ncbi:hypothetical protein HPB47_001994 [Ixodes persulcatus]|uniref:Uncharacterized protein n=1 Tax=Ixodes persulcatus TaxID=34615 RepID=A0AC60PMF8_IXOPE|nr:hypothetical protein HPB47_001994 [Ixodes persulcatus]
MEHCELFFEVVDESSDSPALDLLSSSSSIPFDGVTGVTVRLRRDQASNLVNPGFAPGLFTTIEPERRRACCSHQKLGALDFELEAGHEGAASQRSCQPRPRSWSVKRHHRIGAGRPRAPSKLGPTPVTSKNKAWFRPKQDRRARLSSEHWILSSKTDTKWRPRNVPVNPGRVPGWSSDIIESVLGGPELLASLDPHTSKNKAWFRPKQDRRARLENAPATGRGTAQASASTAEMTTEEYRTVLPRLPTGFITSTRALDYVQWNLCQTTRPNIGKIVSVVYQDVAIGHNSDERGDAKRRPAEVCEHHYSKATRPADVLKDGDELPP